MRSFKFYPLAVNPVYLDLMLVLLAGMIVSAAMVTLGYMIFSQLRA